MVEGTLGVEALMTLGVGETGSRNRACQSFYSEHQCTVLHFFAVLRCAVQYSPASVFAARLGQDVGVVEQCLIMTNGLRV